MLLLLVCEDLVHLQFLLCWILSLLLLLFLIRLTSRKRISEIELMWFVTGPGLFPLSRMNKRLKVGEMTSFVAL